MAVFKLSKEGMSCRILFDRCNELFFSTYIHITDGYVIGVGYSKSRYQEDWYESGDGEGDDFSHPQNCHQEDHVRSFRFLKEIQVLSQTVVLVVVYDNL